MYRLSFYNLIIPNLSDDKNVCIYNTKSGAIVKLEKATYDALYDLKFDDSSVQSYIPELLRQGIIINENKNELREILYNMKRRQFERTEMFSLVIAPTMQCNYRCIYCFEDAPSQQYIMGDAEIDNIVEFVKKRLKSCPAIKKIYVHWFGGEPLLAYEKVIRPLSQKLIELAKEKGINYKSGIITNGYLLNIDVIKGLVEQCLVSDYQITFDGRKANYIRMKRPPSNAYETTMQNMLSFSEYIASTDKKVKVYIRINVDKTNVDDAKSFVEEIKQNSQYKNNLHFYLGRIRGTASSFDVQDFESHENAFDEYSYRDLRFYEPKKIWCNQFTFNSFCIGPHGELYKCEHDFGHEDRVIGDLINGLYFNDFLDKYINQPIAACCEECKIFPVCLGGCPNYKFHSVEQHSCEFTFNRVIQYAEYYVSHMHDRKLSNG